MNRDALFSDGTPAYIEPGEPEADAMIAIRFRTAREDADSVWLVTDTARYPMRKESSKGLFDYYAVSYQLGKEAFQYYFEIRKEDEVVYYNRCGVSAEVISNYNFVIVPGFSTPKWAKGAVMYQIFLDRFCNGDFQNDVLTGEYIYLGDKSVRVENWNQYPASMDVREFYGGDLKGVRDKLDYLQGLGVEVIYFNPIFVSPSNHKYDTQDYDYVDPHYGVIVKDEGELLSEYVANNRSASRYRIRTTSKENLEASNQYLIELIQEIHARGMRVILDGVFNHCGSFNKWMDREHFYEASGNYEPGAYVSSKSRYRNYFNFYSTEQENWPDNDNYEGWWGHNTLPKLNYEKSRELENYILDVGRKWVSEPFCADGWRLDVAADLGKTNEYNHYFWKKFRKAVKEANPDAIILAEHYGDPKEWLQGDEWDTVMNYDAFMEPVTWFLTGMEKHSDEYREDLYCNSDNFVGAMNHHMCNMLTPSLFTAMNQLSNHDHSRFLTRTNHKVGRVQHLGPEAANTGVNPAVMREAVVLQMTWIGAPTLYYGDEAGVCGFTDPDNRRTYPWGHEDKRMIEFHREMIWIHKNYPSLRYGSLQLLTWNDAILSFARFLGDEQIVVILNNGEKLQEVTIPVWRAEVPSKSTMFRLIYTYENGYTTTYEKYLVENGEVVLVMGSHSAAILKTEYTPEEQKVN
ncbi:MAG TPA: alpha-glycosidase [Lachnospiraceae bacterium]|nr:alpha-glycosidase [Lachnospiraceae bacterium]